MTLVKWKKRNDGFPSTFSNYLDNFFNEDFIPGNLATSKPSVNIKETEDSFELELAAPGFEKEEFDIDIYHNVLTVSSATENKTESESENFTRREFNYSSFKRSFTIPESVNAEKIKAEYRTADQKRAVIDKSQHKKGT